MSAQPKHLPAVPADATTLLQVIERAARDPAVDIEKMERLMVMHERILARDAEAAFNDALSACQKETRAVAADADNPQTKSKYATYAALDRALRPIYTAHDFSISWNTAPSDKPEHVRVLGYLSRGGHTRTYQVDMPSDGKGAKGGDVMTKTHATGAGMSYGQRYLLKGMFNVRIGEDDNDGNAHGMPESEIVDWIEKIEKTTTKDKAKEVWHEAVKVAKDHNDAWASKKLKDALIAHGEFIDTTATAK